MHTPRVLENGSAYKQMNRQCLTDNPPLSETSGLGKALTA